MKVITDRKRDPGFIDAGNLLSLVSAVPPSQRSDVLDSNLLAQLVADRKHSRFEEQRQWYRSCIDTLEQLAWRTTFDKLRHLMPAGADFFLRDIVLDAMPMGLDRELAARAMDVFDGLPPEDRRDIVYRKFTCSPSMLVIQVGTSLSDLTLTTVTVAVPTCQVVERPFADPLRVDGLDGDVQVDLYVGLLNLPVYAGIRKDVIEKLGVKREEYIIGLYED